MDDFDLNNSITTSILPIPPPTGRSSNFSRQSSVNNYHNLSHNSNNLNLNNSHSNNNNLPNLNSSNTLMKPPMKTVPEWLMKNETRSGNNNSSSNNNNINNNGDDIFEMAAPASRDIDVIDLKLRPNDPTVEVLSRRRTQKLISTDINNLTGQIDNPVKGSRNHRRRRSRHQTSSLTSLSGLDDDIFSTSKNSTTLSSKDDMPKTPVFLSNPSMRRKSVLRDRISPTPSLVTLIDHLRSDEEPEGVVIPPPASAGSTGAFSRRKSYINLSASNGSRGTSSRQSKRSSGKTTSRKGGGPSYTTARPSSRTGITGGGSAQKKRKKTPKPRCNQSECRKKLNITNGFPCRCQKVFCAKHRHPETHTCTFNYKEEGRKMLEEANPIVTFPKLPKI